MLFLTSTYPRWAGDTTTPFVHELAVALGEHGCRVTVVAPHAPGAAGAERLDGVEVRRFRYMVPDSAETVCYGGGALVRLRDAPQEKAKVPALLAAQWLATLRRRVGGIDVLHAHWVLPQGFVAAVTPIGRIPRVLTVHGGDVFGMRGQTVDRFSAFALRRADRVTVNSEATAGAVREIAGDSPRVVKVPMGVDLRTAPRPDLTAKVRDRFGRPGGPLVMFVGRVIEEKGVEDIVEAVRLALDRLPNISAVIAGAGHHAERVAQLAEAAGVADRVHLPGWVDPADVPSWFAAADIAVAPSRVGRDGWQEGQGLSIIEAMVARVPVVATATGGIGETITDGRTGLLVPPEQPAALADALVRLVRSPDLAAELADAGRRSARDRFDRSHTAEEINRIYSEVISERASSGGRQRR